MQKLNEHEGQMWRMSEGFLVLTATVPNLSKTSYSFPLLWNFRISYSMARKLLGAFLTSLQKEH